VSETPEAAAAPVSEWRDGWRIVLATSLASGTGVVLLFFLFSLFQLQILTETGMTRGEFGTIQAMVVTGAFSAPLIGLAADRYGFRSTFIGCTLMVVLSQMALAFWADSWGELALCIGLIGFFGTGTTALTTTRPANAHFKKYRGRALGLVVAGLSLATIVAPPPVEAISEAYGWRWAIVALAGLSVAVGIPSVLFLLPRGSGLANAPRAKDAPRASRDWLRDRSFWVLAVAGILIGAATSGFIAQLAPMIQEEGVSAMTAALALSAFALGQLIGRLGGGALLDLFAPRWVAVLATLLPGTGFLLLYGVQDMAAVALIAALMIGLVAGIELDINAFFIGRLFPIMQYGTIYGALIALGWIGNAAGVIGVGLLHDRLDSYAFAQLLAMGLLAAGALLYAGLREQPRESFSA
jgi:predicted MFS family arabinose efflux permease